MSEPGQSSEPIDPHDMRAMELLHTRVRDRALSLRWNLNGLMFIYAVLILVLVLTAQNVNSIFVGMVAVVGLLGLWLYSSVRVRKLEKQFYQQEIHDYAELSSTKTQHSPIEDSYVLGHSTTSPLTQRELEILKQIASGKRNKEIAIAMGISESTVKNHISNIFNKLEIYDRMTVVLLAIRYGWIKYDAQQEFNTESGNI
ncbi:MAG: response regulator transcription factor [Dehalococcoidaceae bacterium]|nr:response regulator transcription factor [Dehalococcoidaceae bacterium]